MDISESSDDHPRLEDYPKLWNVYRPFEPRKGNAIDERIKQIMDRHNLKLPIKHFKDNYFLFGPSLLPLEIVQGALVVHWGYEIIELG